MTVVRGLPLVADALAALGKQRRTACGSDGRVRDGVLELEGDHADKLVAWPAVSGFKVKRAGD